MGVTLFLKMIKILEMRQKVQKWSFCSQIIEFELVTVSSPYYEEKFCNQQLMC